MRSRFVIVVDAKVNMRFELQNKEIIITCTLLDTLESFPFYQCMAFWFPKLADRWRHRRYWQSFSLPGLGSPPPRSADYVAAWVAMSPGSAAGCFQYLAVKMAANTEAISA
jgi:hypothetical protein